MEGKDEYGPVDGRCKTGYHKNKTTKMCVAVKHKTKKNTKLANCIKKCPNPLQEYGPAPTRCRKAISKIKRPKCVRIHALNNAKIRMRDRPIQLHGKLPMDSNMDPKKEDVKLDTTKIKRPTCVLKVGQKHKHKNPKVQV